MMIKTKGAFGAWGAIAAIIFFFLAGTSVIAEETDEAVTSAQKMVEQTQANEDIVESHLTMVAVNGKPVSPTQYPEAVVGDIISFRVDIRNNHKQPLYDLKFGADWGSGLAYTGNLRGDQVECFFNEEQQRLVVDAEVVSPSPVDVASCGYGFDLKVTACRDLFLNLYSDELYACQTTKTYDVALRVESPVIHYTVSPAPIELTGNQKQRVIVDIENTGAGPAVDFRLDTGLEAFAVAISSVCAEFHYEPRTGVFRTDKTIFPGQSLELSFDMQFQTDSAVDARKSGPLVFLPSYDDTCGMEFQAPQQYVMIGLPERTGLSVKIKYLEDTAISPGEQIGYEWSLAVPNPASFKGYITLTHQVPQMIAEPWPAISSSAGNVAVTGHTAITWSVSPDQADKARLRVYGKLSEEAVLQGRPLINTAAVRAHNRQGQSLILNKSRTIHPHSLSAGNAGSFTMVQTREARNLVDSNQPDYLTITNTYDMASGLNREWTGAVFYDELYQGDFRYIAGTAEYRIMGNGSDGENNQKWQPVPSSRIHGHEAKGNKGSLVLELWFLDHVFQGKGGSGQAYPEGGKLQLRYTVAPVNVSSSGSELRNTEATLSLPADTDQRFRQWSQSLPLPIASFSPTAKQPLYLEVSLPESIEEYRDYSATVKVKKSSAAPLDDLLLTLDIANYHCLGEPQVSGFNKVIPRVVADVPDRISCIFDAKSSSLGAVTEGGELVFPLRKKCRKPGELTASATCRVHPQKKQYGASTGKDSLVEHTVTTTYQPLLDKTAELDLTVSPACCRVVSPEERIKWSIYVTNRGSGAAGNVRLYNTLGPDMIFESASLDGEPVTTDITTGESSFDKSEVKWQLGEIAPCQTRRVTLNAYPGKSLGQSNILVNPSDVRVVAGEGEEVCLYEQVQAPSFRFPEECLGEVYEKCGNLHGFLGLTQVYKDNMFRTPGDEDDVWATYLTPGIWAAFPGACKRVVEIITSNASPGGLSIRPFFPDPDRVYQAYLLYSPQFEFYDDHDDYNITTHRLDTYFRYNTRNKFSLRLMDQFNYSHDILIENDRRARKFTIDDEYRNNLFDVTATLNLTKRLQLRLDYSNFYVNYTDRRNDGADRMDNSFSLYGFFNLTAKMALFAECDVNYINYDSRDTDSRENRYYGGLRWQITEKSAGRLKAGYGKRDYEESVFPDTDTWVAEILLDHKFSSKTKFVLNAYRRYEEEVYHSGLKVNNLPANSSMHILTEFAGFSMSHDLTPKVHLDFQANIYVDTYEDENFYATPRKERQDTTFALSPMLKFDLLKWLTVDLAYIYTKRISNYPQYDYRDNTAFVRLSLYR